MRLVRLRHLLKQLCFVAWCLLSVSIWAADATTPVIEAPPAPRFDITAFQVEGDTLLGADTVNALVKPYIGPSKDFGDVQQALEALQDAYQARGFNAVHVNLPEQELESGIVRLTVNEQKVGSVKVEGNKFYSDEAVLRAVPSLQEGTNPNIKDLGKTLKIANENPSKQTAVLFTDNETDESKVDTIVKVADDKPWKAFITLDNTGSRETEFGRLTFGYQNFNMFDTDQRLTAEFITNTHYPQNIFNPDHKVHIFAFAYTIPLTSIGDSVDLLASYSDTTSTEPVSLSGLLGSISGKGLVLGAHYNHNFDNLTDYQHKITLGIDSRNTRASTGVLFGPITPELTTTPISATYSGQWTPNQQTVAFSAGFSRNIVGLAEHGDKEDFIASGNANSTFSKFNFSLDYVLPLALMIPVAKDWQFHTAFSSQMSWDRLVSIEKFRIGGMDTVRGFHESALSGDEGYRISFELISPDFGKFMSENAALRGVLFTDTGRVSDNHDSTGIAGVQTTIASVGAGLRYNYGKNWVGRLDVAEVVNGDRENGAGNTPVGRIYGHASIGFMW